MASHVKNLVQRYNESGTVEEREKEALDVIHQSLVDCDNLHTYDNVGQIHVFVVMGASVSIISYFKFSCFEKK